jgi:DNA-binding protein HU-beta
MSTNVRGRGAARPQPARRQPAAAALTPAPRGGPPARPPRARLATPPAAAARNSPSLGQESKKAVDALLDTIIGGVAAGKEVAIPGFGTFKPRTRAARTGRNPKTGLPLSIEAKTAPAFVPGKTFRELVAAAGAKK